jgi:hypothetical protein
MEMKDLINEAKKNAPTLIVRELVEEFAQFAGAMEELKVIKNRGDMPHSALLERINETHSKLALSFLRTADSFGMTFEQFCEHIGNPKNFAPNQWAEIQANKKDIETSLGLSTNKTKKSKLNKNLKI